MWNYNKKLNINKENKRPVFSQERVFEPFNPINWTPAKALPSFSSIPSWTENCFQVTYWQTGGREDNNRIWQWNCGTGERLASLVLPFLFYKHGTFHMKNECQNACWVSLLENFGKLQKKTWDVKTQSLTKKSGTTAHLLVRMVTMQIAHNWCYSHRVWCSCCCTWQFGSCFKQSAWW